MFSIEEKPMIDTDQKASIARVIDEIKYGPAGSKVK
jgi:hypothetical protein